MKKKLILSTILTLVITLALSSNTYAQATITTTVESPSINSLKADNATNQVESTHSQTETENQQTRLAKIKTQADTLINERIKSIQTFISYLQANNLASSTGGQTVISNLNSDIQGLTSLQTQIDSFASTTDIKQTLLPMVQQIFSSYRVYAIELPKDHLLVHDSILSNLNNTYTSIDKTMNSDITFAKSQNKDVSTIQADQTQFDTDVSKFNTEQQKVNSELTAITSADYQKGESTFSPVKTELQTLHTDVENIHKDYLQFVKDFKSLFNTK